MRFISCCGSSKALETQCCIPLLHIAGCAPEARNEHVNLKYLETCRAAAASALHSKQVANSGSKATALLPGQKAA